MFVSDSTCEDDEVSTLRFKVVAVVVVLLELSRLIARKTTFMHRLLRLITVCVQLVKHSYCRSSERRISRLHPSIDLCCETPCGMPKLPHFQAYAAFTPSTCYAPK